MLELTAEAQYSNAEAKLRVIRNGRVACVLDVVLRRAFHEERHVAWALACHAGHGHG